MYGKRDFIEGDGGEVAVEKGLGNIMMEFCSGKDRLESTLGK